MAKSSQKRRRSSRRGISRIHRRPKAFTISNVGAAAIALTPVASFAYESYKTDGLKGIPNALTKAYTGYDTFNGTWDGKTALMYGYVPIAGAIIFKKAMAKLRLRF